MSLSSDGEERRVLAEQQLDLIWVATVSVGEEHSFVGDGGRLQPHADGEGGDGERDFWYDGGVDSSGSHWEEEGHITAYATRRRDDVNCH